MRINVHIMVIMYNQFWFTLFYNVTGETRVAHNLCDRGSRTPSTGVTEPDCDVDRDDSYKGDRFTDCLTAGCAEVDVEYDKFTDVSISQIVKLIINSSLACVQHLEGFCFNSPHTPMNRWWEGGFAGGTRRYNWGDVTGDMGT